MKEVRVAKAQPAATTDAHAGDRAGARYWTVPVVRAALALVPAAVITFTADHERKPITRRNSGFSSSAHSPSSAGCSSPG